MTIVAASMTLSAFAVYQATRASDRAEELVDQARIVHIEASRHGGHVQTLVDHDIGVLRQACQEELRMEAARFSILDLQPQLDKYLAADLTLGGLTPLLLVHDTASCPAADGQQSEHLIERAEQRLQLFQGGAAPPRHADASALEKEAASYMSDEQLLMTAGFLFASVVAGIIVIDQLQARRVRPRAIRTRAARRLQFGLLGAGAVAIPAGLVLLTLHAFEPNLTAGLLGVIGVVVMVQRAWVRSVRTPPPPAGVRSRTRWWADLVGALTLAAFTAAAVGLSLVSVEEREATTRSDRQNAIALELQRAGEQQALRDLTDLSTHASLDAEEATARQLSSPGLVPALADPSADAVAAMRDALGQRMKGADDQRRAQSWSSLAQESVDDCAVPDHTEVRPAADLYLEVASTPGAIMRHVLAQQRPAQACDVVAALSRHEARLWSSLGNTLTVALVILGLAGFLLALAASSDRSARSSRTLFWFGTGGTALGFTLALLAGSAWLAGTRVPAAATAQGFGQEVASGLADPCSGLEALNEAVETFGDYAPAFEGRAYARNCTEAVHDWPALSADLRPGAVDLVLDDVTRAIELGPETPLLIGDRGWFRMLDGLQSKSPAQVQRGVDDTRTAIDAIERAVRSDTDRAVHVLRFNLALGLAALGRPEAALAAYEQAARCIDPDQDCRGGGIVDRDVEDNVRLSALADIELLDADDALDRYRLAILGLQEEPVSVAAPDDAELQFFPQELQLTTDEAAPPPVSVIWYHRADPGATWAVLPTPSGATREEGAHLNTPFRAAAPLASGEYRADVYSTGSRVEISDTFEANPSAVRFVSPRIGMSLVAPDTWKTFTDDGADWWLGLDETTGVALRRVEGVSPDDIDAFLREQLTEWTESAGQGEPEFEPADWFLGLDDYVFARNADRSTIMAAGLAPYASHGRCGGTLFLARVTGGADTPTEDLFDSIVLERSAAKLPALATAQADGMRMDIPAHWDAAVRPDSGTGTLIKGKDCRTQTASLLVDVQPYTGRVADEVNRSIQEYSASFPNFVLEERWLVDVPGAVEAEEILYSWVPEHLGVPVTQWQLYAKGKATLAYATITAHSSDRTAYIPDVDLLLGSFTLTGG